MQVVHECALKYTTVRRWKEATNESGDFNDDDADEADNYWGRVQFDVDMVDFQNIRQFRSKHISTNRRLLVKHSAFGMWINIDHDNLPLHNFVNIDVQDKGETRRRKVYGGEVVKWALSLC